MGTTQTVLTKNLTFYNFILVLKTWSEIGECIMSQQESGGPLHGVPQKNWDLFHMIKIIEEKVPRSGYILDVGTSGCPILEALLRRGYSNLYGIDYNLLLREKFHRVVMGALHRRDFRIFCGYTPIRLKKGNFCQSSYPDNYFDAITSLSVIEHGIEWEDYFEEMSRILKPGGYLLTSTDYWYHNLPTDQITAYGYPMKVFTPSEIKQGLYIAFQYGFKKIDATIPDCVDPCVTWNGFRFTFLLFVLQKIL